MTAGDPKRAPLAEYAEAHGLAYAERAELPANGRLLTEHDLTQHGAATGVLPGGERGTVCHLSYTVRSDDQTRTERRTVAIVRVPESIGFAPYLGNAAGGVVGRSTRSVDLDGGGRLIADEGIDRAWLAELLSPAFSHWLQRSPDDFTWELADGVLSVARAGHLTSEQALNELCGDASRIAITIREECLEEVEAGSAARSAADPAEPDADTRLARAILDRTTFADPPADVVEARPQFRDLVVRHPSTYFVALFMTLAWMLGVNVIGAGIFGLLLNLPNPGLSVLVFELCLFAVIGFLCLRSQINGVSAKLASEGFWREYARTRDLRFVDPRAFAAAHAKAGLPGAPVRVMTGTFAGAEGALMITGDGLKRGDFIALVGGSDGPVASTEFDVSAPGASAKALDAYTEDLVAQLRAR